MGEYGDGGGIYNIGTLSITYSTFTENSSVSGGGGISNSGEATVTDSVFLGNSAGSGGGIKNTGTLSVTNSTLSRNSASYDGGGIRCFAAEGTVMLTVTNSTISGNSSVYRGGGISNLAYDGTAAVTVSNSILAGNSAGEEGGGIYNCSDGGATVLTVINSMISSNSASSGGGIYRYSGSLTVTNSTISGNSVFYSGGGLFSYGSTIGTTLHNSIIAENSAGTGADIYVSKGSLSGSHNFIGDGSEQDSLIDGTDGNIVGTSENPVDPQLSNWTQFDDGSWGYYLMNGSPALDAGDNSLAVDVVGLPLDKDIYGNARIQNGTVDIGAIESATVGTSAQIYVVTSLTNTIAQGDGELTFFEAFAASQSNQPAGDAPAGSFSEQDIIRFADGLGGSVLLDGDELTIFGDLSIEGPGAASLIFDAQGQSRAFNIQPSVSCNLNGMTITGGSAEDGGGILNSGTLTVTNSTIAENSADRDGGGVYNLGILTVADSTLSSNTATNYGGGIITKGTLTINFSMISANSAPCGAGIFNKGTLTAVVTTVSSNIGGGIYTEGTSTVTNCTIQGNSVGYQGGGITNAGKLTVTDSMISENLAGSQGGGISNRGTMTVINSRISCNLANSELAENGSGIYNSGSMTLRSSMISGNFASGYGGGIYMSSSSDVAWLYNTIVAGNYANTGSDIYYSRTSLVGMHNLIGDGSNQTSLINGKYGNIVGTTENPTDPLFLRNPSDGGDGWGDNPDTSDIDESLNDDYGDLRLRYGSPAINAGSNDLAVDTDGYPLETDIVGKSRIQNGTVDIGAYEFSALSGDANIDGTVDAADASIVAANWQMQSGATWSEGDFNDDGRVDDIDATLMAVNWHATLDPPPQLPGDANGDGTVDVVDLGIIASNYGTVSGAEWGDGDFNGDGKVDVFDLGNLAKYYGQTLPPPTSSPAAIVSEALPDDTDGDTAEPSAAACDFDKDGRVGLGDLAFFSSVYGEQPGVTSESPYAYAADFDGSGTVDLGDLAIFSAGYQSNRLETSIACVDEVGKSSPPAPKTSSTSAEPPVTILSDDIVRDNDIAILAMHWLSANEDMHDDTSDTSDDEAHDRIFGKLV